MVCVWERCRVREFARQQRSGSAFERSGVSVAQWSVGAERHQRANGDVREERRGRMRCVVCGVLERGGGSGRQIRKGAGGRSGE